MDHPIYRIDNVEVLTDYRLRVRFDDGAEKTIDLWPVLHGEMYGALVDRKLFAHVRVDHETGTVQWPNGADFDPAVLYHWEENLDELVKRAKEWETG